MRGNVSASRRKDPWLVTASTCSSTPTSAFESRRRRWRSWSPNESNRSFLAPPAAAAPQRPRGGSVLCVYDLVLSIFRRILVCHVLFDGDVCGGGSARRKHIP